VILDIGIQVKLLSNMVSGPETVQEAGIFAKASWLQKQFFISKPQSLRIQRCLAGWLRFVWLVPSLSSTLSWSTNALSSQNNLLPLCRFSNAGGWLHVMREQGTVWQWFNSGKSDPGGFHPTHDSQGSAKAVHLDVWLAPVATSTTQTFLNESH